MLLFLSLQIIDDFSLAKLAVAAEVGKAKTMQRRVAAAEAVGEAEEGADKPLLTNQNRMMM